MPFLKKNEITGDPIPEVGKIYYAYDDGKIRKSREFLVIVQKIVKPCFVPKRIKKVWKQNVKDYHWLINPKTDFFIYAKTVTDEWKECYFVRTKSGEWFSLDFPSVWSLGQGAQLDVTGELHSSIEELGV